jgi:protein involved in polysaccharide export with SLBB domain
MYSQNISTTDLTSLKLKELTSVNSNTIKKIPANYDNLIDNSIDPDAYFIGGGDVFSIHIVELPSVEYKAVVDQNCDAIIPEFGVIRIGRKTLTDAKNMVTDFVKSCLKKNYNVYVSLSNVKNAVVTISGAVTNPGTYQLDGTNRIIDVIRQANGNVLPNLYDVNFREILCVNRDSTDTLDLFGFLFHNDNKRNPYVYPGDNIFVPMTSRRVLVSGCFRTSFGGMLPIKNNEKAIKFLSLLLMDGAADTDNIIITKHDANGSGNSIIFSMSNPGDITLSDRDIIIIPQIKNYPRFEIVTVSGEVNRPGQYSFIRGKTTGRNIIEEAGGPTNYGNMNRAVIIRKEKINIIQKALNPAAAQGNQMVSTPVRPPVSNIRAEIASAITNINSSNDYSIIPLRGTSLDELVEANDEILIPKIDNKVYVSGNVKMPGAYLFSEGKLSDYYIQLAGGYASRADKTNVFTLTQYSEQYQIKEGNVIEEGDVIVVPESQQYKYTTTILFPLISIVLSAISTAMVMYYYVTLYNND